MLIISRRIGEDITIGDNIRIVVMEVYEGRHGARNVRLGIDAPADVPIRRDNYTGPTPADAKKQ